MSQNDNGGQLSNQPTGNASATTHEGPSPSSEPTPRLKERRGLSHRAAVNLELEGFDIYLGDEEVLRDDNWIYWKMRILNLLRMVDLKGYALGKIPRPDKALEPDKYEVWDARDRGAIHILLRNITNEELQKSSVCFADRGFTSAELWNSLREIHEDHSPVAIVSNMRKLFTAQAEDGCDIDRHITNLQLVRFELAEAGHRIKDELFNCALVASLPPSWDNYTMYFKGLQTIPNDTKLSTSTLTGLLLSEYRRRLDDPKSPEFKKRKRDDEPCAICRKSSHIAESCRWKNGGYCTSCERGGHWTSKCKRKSICQ